MLNSQTIREQFRFMRGNILVITLTRILGMFCRSMVFPYASLFILALGGDPTQIGYINALKPLAGLLMFPIGGYLTDHVGRVKLITLGGYLSGAILLMYILAPNWQIVALAGLIQGFMVFQFPPSSALIADSLSPDDRGKGSATMNTIAGALAMFSPFIAGAVLDNYGDDKGMRLLYIVMLIAYFASAYINQRYLTETAAPTRKSVTWSVLPTIFKEAYGGIISTFKALSRTVLVLAVIITLGFTCNAVASSFWVVYATDEIGLTATQWGSILLVETLLCNLLYIPAGMAVDRYGRSRFILASLMLSLVTVPLFIIVRTPTQALLVRAASAVTNAFFMPATIALMADSVPRKLRGRVMAAVGRGAVMLGPASGGTGGPGMGFLITVPVMLGSIAGGYLYTANPAWPWLFVAVATALSVLLTVLFLRDPEQAHV